MGRGRHGSGVSVHGPSLRIRFRYQGKRCTEVLPMKPTSANIKAAERLVSEIRQKIALGVFDYAATFPNSKNIKVEAVAAETETVSAYAAVWLKTLVGEKSTLDGYRSSINNFWLTALVTEGEETVTLGSLAITAVRHSHIATVVASAAEDGLTGKTTNNHLIPIRALFDAAKADRKIGASPAADVHNRKHQKDPPDPFTRAEMDAILSHMARYPGPIRNYFLFAFTTGMRTSELIALRWGDIDWAARTAQVKRAIVRHKVKGTKTHQVRDVDLNDLAMEALLAQKAHTFLRGDDHPVFCDVDGAPWLSERKLREDYFHPCLKACGIRRRPAYNTRHTYATVALMGSINPAYIARQLGHASTAMLFKHYAKWIEQADGGQQAGRLNAVFGPQLAHSKTNAN